MITYEIVPHVGVGPIKLGMTRDEVRRVMPVPCSPYRKSQGDLHETDAFHEYAYQVYYNGESPVVEFIELSDGLDYIASYRGTDVFSTPAAEMVVLVSREAAFDPDYWELGRSYTFPSIDIALWRPVLPEESDGEAGIIFSTIAIGVEGYFAEA